MKRKALAYCLIGIELLIQIFGSIDYDQTPAFVWALADAIVILVPLVFGLRLGWLCLLPVAVCEIVWFCKLHAISPLLHIVSFAVTVLILGLANKKLIYTPNPQRVIVSSLLYEGFLLGEEALYRGLIMLFLQRPVTWENVSGIFLSPANPLLLVVLVLCCLGDREPEGGEI
jgi:hypothetical protein